MPGPLEGQAVLLTPEHSSSPNLLLKVKQILQEGAAYSSERSPKSAGANPYYSVHF